MTPDDLKQWRKTLKLSQAEAARALYMTLRGYQYLEAGARRIDGRTALACAAVLRNLPPYGS